MKPIIVGIAGGTGSGKSTLANSIKNAFGEKAILMCHDNYYKSNDHLEFEERTKINYDHPDAYDIDLLTKQINDLKNDIAIDKPVYDFVIHNRSKEIIEHMEPSNIVIIEGILTLAIKEIRDLCDIKLYVDTPDDIRFIRRVKRDMNERGRTLESVVNQYLETVRPMHLTFVEPSKRYADIIVPEGGKNQVAVDILVTKIKDILKS